MRVLEAIGVSLGFGLISIASAQQSLVGKYSGQLEVQPPGTASPVRLGIELDITHVEGNKVKGSLRRYAKQCGGVQPIAGTLSGEKLRLSTVKEPSQVLGCPMAFDLVVAGGKLAGTKGIGAPIEFTK